VVVLGGLGSVGGAALAGFLVGVGYAFVATYVSVDWTTGVGWLLVIVMLLARPRGLLGAKQMRV
jgi:branched-chain amino acid transport system permease protein